MIISYENISCGLFVGIDANLSSHSLARKRCHSLVGIGEMAFLITDVFAGSPGTDTCGSSYFHMDTCCVHRMSSEAELEIFYRSDFPVLR